MNDESIIPEGSRTISQTILDLQNILTEHGDLPVASFFMEDGYFAFDFGQHFETIELPIDEYDLSPNAPTQKIAVYVWPESTTPQKPQLKVVKDEQ
jgi:hypothetical protein